MDVRRAKREACWKAATVLRTALQGQEELYDDYGGEESPDGSKVAKAMYEVIEELERRGYI